MNEITVAILMPVFEDWQSFKLLTMELDDVLKEADYNAIVIAVDDGSLISASDTMVSKLWNLNFISRLEVVHLTRNIGHQKAIAIGLSYIHNHIDCQAILVMDSDGEDRPEDGLRLITEWEQSKDKILFAKRSNRSEGVAFKFFYKIYRLIFQILTGKKIYFGNFSIIPGQFLKRVVYLPDIWNHYAAGLLRANIPWRSISTTRGIRYQGHSKMNFVGLVLHGLSAISVYIDILSVRLMIVTLFMILVIAFGFMAILYVKLGTTLAIPGWATNTVIGLTIITAESILFLTLLTFLVFNFRTNKLFIPALDYTDYLLNVESLGDHQIDS